MTDAPIAETTTRPRKTRVAPPAGRPTLPATDSANPESPLMLSPDAHEGTKDRATAFSWTEQGHLVRKRADGVYERIVAPPEPELPVDELLEFYPDVEALDRRVLDPTVDRDVPIMFRDETNLRPGQQSKYYKRWVDTARPHRLLTLTQRAGFKKAEWSMLADKTEIGDRFEGAGAGMGTDNYVRRGEKGQFMLLFMPYVKWLEIKTAQANRRTESERASMGAGTADTAAKALGARAGEVLSRADSAGRPGLFGLGPGGAAVTEGRPMGLEAFQGSGMPKDLASGEAVTLDE